MIKDIHQANAFLTRLGRQRAEPGMRYIENPCLIKEGGAWFNPLTCEAIYTDGDPQDVKTLMARWFYVPETFDIRTAAQIIRQKTLADTQVIGWPSKTSYVIFTTTACNASCEYCFEKNLKIMTMTDAGALDVARHIVKTRRKSGTTILKWFGGEPLVNQRAINIITAYLDEMQVDFRSDITTNGDLLDRIPDARLENWRLKEVQLTLDDIGTEYGRMKGLDPDAYARIKAQAERLSDMGMRVIIRIHYHPDRGLEPAFRIVEDLKHIKNVSMYGRIIYKTESPENYKKLLELEDYMEKAGVFRPTFPKRGNGRHCMADNRHIDCITPDGHLSPCEHYAYGENFGSIYTKNMDAGILAEWQAREKQMCAEPCAECKLYPCCEKILMCPAEGDCTKGYMMYQIEQIRRALRYASRNLQAAPEQKARTGTIRAEAPALVCGVC